MKKIMTLKTVPLKLDLRKNYVKTQKGTKAYTKVVKDKDIQTLFNCTECHYRTVQLTELKRHKFKQHCIGKIIEEKPAQTLLPVQIPKMDCIHCKFDCDDHNELETHIDEHHKKEHSQQEKEKSPLNSPPCSECKTKDDTLKEQVQKIERLELNITDVESNLAASELERKKTLNENEAIQIEYQKITRVVAKKQRKLTENAETIKVQTSLGNVDEERREREISSGNEPNSSTEVWKEVWEEVGDETGNLIKQRRKEVQKFQWKPDYACKKCDKVLETDQHLRQHVKGVITNPPGPIIALNQPR